jgi:hypothetical protein
MRRALKGAGFQRPCRDADTLLINTGGFASLHHWLISNSASGAERIRLQYYFLRLLGAIQSLPALTQRAAIILLCIDNANQKNYWKKRCAYMNLSEGWLPRVRKLGRDGKVTTLATISKEQQKAQPNRQIQQSANPQQAAPRRKLRAARREQPGLYAVSEINGSMSRYARMVVYR